ncbi:MAG: 50S ribosomal protein L25/general stress protein Ctc [Gammaproteobacteria bacterium]|nr:MAG: 50S ribosomal protein L25/general stress protein Ctc [Gammaproteobacteria bacterium]
MATVEINAELRNDKGKGASRRLRRAGQVPAVVYGGGKEPATLTLDENELMLALSNEAFYSKILELKVGEKRQKVVLRDIQRHPVRPTVQHVDFQRIVATEKVRMNVPLHFVDQDESPAGKMSGVVISHQITAVEVSCLPEHLPEFIEVDLSTIDVGDTIPLSDLKLPDGVILAANEVELAEPMVTAAHVQEVVEEEEEVEELEGEAVEGEEGEAPAEGAASEDGGKGDGES